MIIGPSGGGKGTQAKLLEKKLGIKHISLGAVFRKEIEKKSKLGKAAKRFVVQGLWVPTEIVIATLKPVLRRALDKGFILDGFPRLPDQPPLLDEFLAKQGGRLDLVIHLQVSTQEIMRRRENLAKKGKGFYSGQKRKDESREAIISRLAAYEKTIKPILAYYRKKRILIEVDGERKVKLIHQEVLQLVGKKVKK